MTEYVLDTEPLIAFLYREPGHESVRDIIEAVATGEADGLLASVNASELLYLIARIEGEDGSPTPDSLRTADRDLRSLTRLGIDIEHAPWSLAGEVKATGSISLADAYAVALAASRSATLVVGGDGDFDSLPVDIELRRFRDHAV